MNCDERKERDSEKSIVGGGQTDKCASDKEQTNPYVKGENVLNSERRYGSNPYLQSASNGPTNSNQYGQNPYQYSYVLSEDGAIENVKLEWYQSLPFIIVMYLVFFPAGFVLSIVRLNSILQNSVLKKKYFISSVLTIGVPSSLMLALIVVCFFVLSEPSVSSSYVSNSVEENTELISDCKELMVDYMENGKERTFNKIEKYDRAIVLEAYLALITEEWLVNFSTSEKVDNIKKYNEAFSSILSYDADYNDLEYYCHLLDLANEDYVDLKEKYTDIEDTYCEIWDYSYYTTLYVTNRVETSYGDGLINDIAKDIVALTGGEDIYYYAAYNVVYDSFLGEYPGDEIYLLSLAEPLADAGTQEFLVVDTGDTEEVTTSNGFVKTVPVLQVVSEEALKDIANDYDLYIASIKEITNCYEAINTLLKSSVVIPVQLPESYIEYDDTYMDDTYMEDSYVEEDYYESCWENIDYWDGMAGYYVCYSCLEEHAISINIFSSPETEVIGYVEMYENGVLVLESDLVLGEYGILWFVEPGYEYFCLEPIDIEGQLRYYVYYDEYGGNCEFFLVQPYVS